MLYFHKKQIILPFLSEDNKDKKYYNDGRYTPSMAIVLNQMIHYQSKSIYKKLVF